MRLYYYLVNYSERHKSFPKHKKILLWEFSVQKNYKVFSGSQRRTEEMSKTIPGF